MHFVVRLPSTQQGNDAIWVIVDSLTKSTHFILMCTSNSVDRLAELYNREVVRLHGVPVTIVSDRDPHFTAQLWQSLQEALRTKLTLSTYRRPRTSREGIPCCSYGLTIV